MLPILQSLHDKGKRQGKDKRYCNASGFFFKKKKKKNTEFYGLTRKKYKKITNVSE